MDMTLVKSNLNQMDHLTRIPERWLDLHRKGAEQVQVGYTTMNVDQVANIPQQNGHPVMKRTLYFARSVDPSVSTKVVKSVINACKICKT